MNRNSTPMVVIFAMVGLAIAGFIGLGSVFLIFVLPRIPFGKSALQQPATPNMSAAEFNLRGNEMYRQRLFKRAVVEYGHMIEKAPEDPSGYMLRGMANEEAGDYKAAVRDDTEGLKRTRITEMRDSFYHNRGLAYRYLGDYPHAIADYNQAIGLNPQNWSAYESRAFCYTSQGDYDWAIADYTVAIAADAHPGTMFERGQAYLKKKEYRKALADFDLSLKSRPNFVPALHQRADAYVGLKEYDRAVADAEEALRLDNSANSRGTLGWYQYLAGNLPQAIENSQAAIKMDSSLNFARFNLGLCYAAQGNATAAQAAYEEALQHAKTGDIQGGIQDVKDALAKQPNSPALQQAATLLQTALPRASAAS
jgi:tetratricopeptide (TPR) repeat protein